MSMDKFLELFAATFFIVNYFNATIFNFFFFSTHWILVPIFFIPFLIYEVENKNGILIFPTIMAFVYLYHSHELFDPIYMVKKNPISTLLLVCGYVFIGGIWSTIKWWYYLHNMKISHEHNEEKIDIDKFAENYFTKHQFQIYSWVLYWPFSIVYAITHDFINNLFRRLKNIYITIAVNHLKNKTLHQKNKKKEMKEMVELNEKEINEKEMVELNEKEINDKVELDENERVNGLGLGILKNKYSSPNLQQKVNTFNTSNTSNTFNTSKKSKKSRKASSHK